jgi:uncharacterized membrane protein YgaE (UPF0421/DUF939 family)
METALFMALVSGFIGVLCFKLLGFNPFSLGLVIAVLVIPLLTLLVHNDTETALVVLNQVVVVFPVLIMESLGATLALAVFGES